MPENEQDVRAAAICRYDGASGGLYLFYCDEQWRVVSDWSEPNADDLKDTVRQHFGVSPGVDRAKGCWYLIERLR